MTKDGIQESNAIESTRWTRVRCTPPKRGGPARGRSGGDGFAPVRNNHCEVLVFVIFLVIASAFLHALWNALLKRQPETSISSVAGILFSAVFSLLPVPFEAGPHFPGWSVLFGLGAGLFEAGYVYTLGLSLQRAPLSNVYPLVRGGALLVVWPVSVLLLGEPFYWWALLGISLLWLGLFLCARPQSPAVASAPRGGLWLAVLCALCIGGYNLCYKGAVHEGATPLALCAVSLTLSVPLSLLLLGREAVRKLRLIRGAWLWSLLLIGLLSALSFIFFVVALRSYDAGASLTLRNVSIVFAQLLSLWLGERPSRLQWIGAVLVTVGAIVVNLRP